MKSLGARVGLGWLGLGLVAGLLISSCFEGPELDALYRCDTDANCGGDGLICFDGVCCQPRGEPLCLGYVFPDGSCADGGTAQTYYADSDEDGFGDTQSARQFCAPPVSLRYVGAGGDCNDNPEAGGALAQPGRVGDACDGVDNDCDGTVDEDATTRSTFFLDKDGDGHGEAALSLEACAAPLGYVSSADDCAPTDAAVFPGAPERCNGVSDDCDAIVDEGVPGTGESCVATGVQGQCVQGSRSCVSGTLVCSPGAPTRDRCDGLDNDCDGEVDEAPDCGGPPSFLAAGVAVSWRAMSPPAGPYDSGAAPTSCFRNDTDPTETFTGATWSGAGIGAHVLTVETTGPFWDLTKPNTRLRLKYTYALGAGATTAPYWFEFRQPLVLLCGVTNAQFNRYVHGDGSGTPTGGTLMSPSSAGGSVDTVIPFFALGEPGWILGSGSSVDLSAVRRLEILISPTSAAPMTVTLQDFGFDTGP